MYFPLVRPRAAAVMTCAAVTGLLAGCATVDAGTELDRMRDVVHSRSGVAFSHPDPAQEAADAQLPPAPLTGDGAARLALENHPSLRAGVESIVRARADFAQAHLLPNPVLNFTMGFASDGGSGNPIMAPLLQPLTALWQRPSRVDAADARLRATVLSVSNGALELVAAARIAHAEAVYAQQQLDLRLEAEALATETVALVEQRLAAGEATALDANGARLESLAATMRATEARTQRDRTLRTLVEICGLATTFRFPQLAPADPIPSTVDQLDERVLVATAETQRLDLAAARVLIEEGLDGVRLAELRALGNMSAGAAFLRNQMGRTAIGPALRIEIPIFDDGRAAVAAAESNARAARAEADLIHQHAILQIRTAFVRLRGDRANLALARDSVLALAAKNRALAERSLELGVVNRIRSIEVTQKEVAARLEVNRLAQAARVSFIELERVLGGRVPTPEEVGP